MCILVLALAELEQQTGCGRSCGMRCRCRCLFSTLLACLRIVGGEGSARFLLCSGLVRGDFYTLALRTWARKKICQAVLGCCMSSLASRMHVGILSCAVASTRMLLLLSGAGNALCGR